MIYDEANFPDLPSSWASLVVEDAYHNVSVKQKTKAGKYLTDGRLAVVDQGAKLVGGYINDMSASVTTDLPVVVFGDHTRAIKYIDFLFAAGADGIKVLKPKDFYHPKLFYHFLRAIRLPDKGYARHFQYLRSSEIALAPTNEQKRIAEKLDSVLTSVDSCQLHLERIPQILKRFRQSVLAAATSGRLTADWGKEHHDLPEYRTVTLREVASAFNYGTSAKSLKSGKVPVLRMGNIQDGKLDWNDLVFTSDKDEIEKYDLVMGDVLFNRTNSPEWVGKTAVYKGERPAIYAGYLIRFKCGPELRPDFINYCLNSPKGRDWRWQVKSDGVSQSNINAQKLADFEFELPPIEEQAEIVRRVEKLFAYADRLEARYQSAVERVEQLTSSLLAKAFRGELVEQDPDDEPASVLLEKIERSRNISHEESQMKLGL